MTKWYVNLQPPQKKGDPEGPELHLKAKRSVASRIKGGHRQVNWAVTAVEDKSGLATDLSRKAAAQCTFIAGAQTTDVKGEFTNTLKFSQIGGMRYQITCTKEAGDKAEKSTATYVSWRRVFYTVYTMNALCKQVWAKLESRLKDALAESYIELVKLRAADTHRDESARGTIDGGAAESLFDPPRQAKGPQLALVFVNHFYSTKNERLDKAVTAADLVKEGASTWVEFTLPADYAGEVSNDWPTPGMIGGCKYKSPVASVGEQVQTLRIAKRVSAQKVAVDLKDNPDTIAAIEEGYPASVNVDVRFDVKSKTAAFVTMNQPYAVMSVYGNDATMSIDARAEKVFQGLLHELGHQLDLTHMGMANHYERLGGQGPHCKKNCEPVEVGPGTPHPELPAATLMTPNRGADTCVMYHSVVHRGTPMGKFCELCQPGALATKLSTMPGSAA